MAPAATSPTFEVGPSKVGTKCNIKSSNGIDGSVRRLSTAEIVALDDQYGIRGMPAYPIVMERGRGAYLWDQDGKKYLDLLAGFSSVSQGHCHPQIVDAVVEQTQRLMLPGRSVHTLQYTTMCKKLCELFNFDVAAAMNSGSEAIDLAVKIARKWGYSKKGIESGEAIILTASGNYHGRTTTSLSASTNHMLREDCGPFLPNIGPIIDGEMVHFGNTYELEKCFQKHGHKIAAFMIETVQGSAGCIPPPVGYLTAVRDLCTKYNVLWIADEVQCGLGRTGYMAAYQIEEVQPDIAVLGKALVGGAYSMGLVMGHAETMRCYKYGQHGSTFAGNPVAAAAAIAAIDVLIDEKLPERARRIGEELLERMSSLKSSYVAAVHGRGMLFSVFIDESDPDGPVTAAKLASLLLERGIMTYASGNKIRIGPPLVIEEEDLWAAIDEIEKALEELERT